MGAKIEKSCKEVRCYLRIHGQNRKWSFTEVIHPRHLPLRWQLAWTQDGQSARELQSQWENQWQSQPARWCEFHPRPPKKGSLQLY